MPFRCRMVWSRIGRRGFLFSASAILLFYSLVAAAQSQELRLQFSAPGTRVTFTLGDLLHTVHGSFNLKSGEVQYDLATAGVRGSLVVDATSGQTNNRMRDRRMHREILETDHYPEITFRPDRVEGKLENPGTSTVQVHGVFSIHGTDHELTIPVRVQVFPDHWIADTNFTVPYVKWGIKNPSTFLLRVSESVEIEVHATGLNPPANPSGH